MTVEVAQSEAIVRLVFVTHLCIEGRASPLQLENRLNDTVCAGEMSLSSAQRLIASDWVRAYRRVFG